MTARQQLVPSSAFLVRSRELCGLPGADDLHTALRDGAAVFLRETGAPWSTIHRLHTVALQVVAPDGYNEDRQEHPIEIHAPEVIVGSAPPRRRTFLAGRAAAELALRRFGVAQVQTIGIAAHRGPVWPSGVVGSISHTPTLAAASVGASSDFRGIGIDLEQRLSDSEIASVAPLVAPEWCRGAVQLSGECREPADVVTAIFSAKESLFKCLRPLVDDFFDFTDASMTSLDLTHGRGRLRLVRDLTHEVHAGTEFDVLVLLGDTELHTLVTWPR